VDRRLDLAAVAHDPRVTEEPRHVAGAEARHLGEIEAGEGLAKGLALAEDGEPAQARLKTFQAQLLEEADVILHRTAPLLVVLGLVVLGLAGPPAADAAVGAADQAGREPDRRRHRGTWTGRPSGSGAACPTARHQGNGRSICEGCEGCEDCSSCEGSVG